MRAIPLVAVGLLLLLAGPLAPGSLAQSQGPSLPDIEDEVMCPTCGTSLALSESPQANLIRDQIRTLIDEGRSKDEIKDALVGEYGSEVLATPETSGFDLAAWVVPGLAILIAGGALAVGIRRWRATGASDAQTTAAGAGPAPDADAERELEADLRRYEL